MDLFLRAKRINSHLGLAMNHYTFKFENFASIRMAHRSTHYWMCRIDKLMLIRMSAPKYRDPTEYMWIEAIIMKFPLKTKFLKF